MTGTLNEVCQRQADNAQEPAYVNPTETNASYPSHCRQDIMHQFKKVQIKPLFLTRFIICI